MDHPTSLERRITEREALVGILGLGYVGVPLALAFADAGFPVLGFDVDAAKCATLQLTSGQRPVAALFDTVTEMWLEDEDEFARAVRGDATPEVGGARATASLAVIRAGVLSVTERRAVDVAEILAEGA